MVNPSVKLVIDDCLSHDLWRRRRDLAELLTGLAFDPCNQYPCNEDDPNKGSHYYTHYWDVRSELDLAFRELSATATDMLIVALLKAMRLNSSLPLEYSRLVRNQKKGRAQQHAPIEQRNLVIDNLMRQGIDKDKDIYDFMVMHHREWVFDKRKSTLISCESMMDAYCRSSRARARTVKDARKKHRETKGKRR
jgi:hypothetical protein